jgi:hypothetical protein
VDVTLVHTDPQHAFIDFAHGGAVSKTDHGFNRSYGSNGMNRSHG